MGWWRPRGGSELLVTRGIQVRGQLVRDAEAKCCTSETGGPEGPKHVPVLYDSSVSLAPEVRGTEDKNYVTVSSL